MKRIAIWLATLLTSFSALAVDEQHEGLGEWAAVSVVAVDPMLIGPIKIRFKVEKSGGSVTGLGGCNVIRRSFEIKDGEIVLKGPMVATRMYCGGLKKDIQSVVGRILSHSQGWTIENGHLVLRGKDGTKIAEFARRIDY